MIFSEVVTLLENKFGKEIITGVVDGMQPQCIVRVDSIKVVCEFLLKNEQTYFDFLACITGIDNGPQKGTMDVIYNIYSIPFNHHFTIKAELKRNGADEEIPAIDSVCDVWRTANWLERETYDLLGIKFNGHPDLRRILLPADWEGYPLRKDYKEQEYYHGITVKY